jgi:hypothetical protein
LKADEIKVEIEVWERRTGYSAEFLAKRLGMEQMTEEQQEGIALWQHYQYALSAEAEEGPRGVT